MGVSDFLRQLIPGVDVEERKIHDQRTDYLLHPPPIMDEGAVTAVCAALGGVGSVLGGVLTVDARTKR